MRYQNEVGRLTRTEMTTITAETFAMNLEHYFKEAVKRGLRVVTPEGRIFSIEEVDCTYSEEELKARWDKAHSDQQEGKLQRTSTPEELSALLASL